MYKFLKLLAIVEESKIMCLEYSTKLIAKEKLLTTDCTNDINEQIMVSVTIMVINLIYRNRL